MKTTTTTVVGISLPDDLLALARNAAGPRKLSKFVAEAIREKLKRAKK